MACSQGCPTQDHRNFGECLRSKGVAVQGLESTGNDYTRQKQWDKELDRARGLMSKGIMPDNTFGPALDKAEKISDATGVAYRGDA